MKSFILLLLSVILATSLWAQHVKIYRSLNDALKDSDKVKKLSLDSGDDQKTLSPEILKLKNLEEFDIESYPKLDIKQTIQILSHLKHLRSFGFYCDGVKTFPDEIVKLKHLEDFDIACKTLIELPASISKLKHLRTIYIASSPQVNWSKLFDELQYVTNLKSLWLDDDSISKIPENITKLKKLQALSFWGDLLTGVPEEIKKMPLKSLNLSGNKIKYVNLSSEDNKVLNTISLRQNNIEIFPKDLCSITSLRTIDLDRNQISSIPDDIANLTRLEYLDMEGNRLSLIPDTLTKLVHLKQLMLDGNKLTASGIKPFYQMRWVTNLELQGNKINLIDPRIANLKHLKELDISDNPITELPKEIMELRKLQWLEIGFLPQLDWDRTFLMLAQLPNLNKLSIFFDNLKTMPNSFEKLKRVTYFIMNNNDFDEKEEQRIKAMFPGAQFLFD